MLASTGRSGKSGDVRLALPRRFVEPEDRHVFSAIGAWSIVVGALQLTDPSAGSRLWLAPLWPSLLIVAGVLTFAFRRQLTSVRLRAWAAALYVVATVGRAGALTLSLVDGTAHSWQSACVGIALWSFTGWLLYVTWRVRVPWPTTSDR